MVREQLYVLPKKHEITVDRIIHDITKIMKSIGASNDKLHNVKNYINEIYEVMHGSEGHTEAEIGTVDSRTSM